MAEVHVLDQNIKKDRLRVVYHITIPDANNVASFSYRTALVEYLDPEGAGIISSVPNLDVSDATEFAALQSGAVFQEMHTVEFDANLNDSQKSAIIDSHYMNRKDTILTSIQSKLRYWGLERNPS